MRALRLALVAATLLGLAGAAMPARAQSSREAERKLEQAQRALRQVAAERRRIEGERSAASRALRAADEKLGSSSRGLHETEARLAEQRAALAGLEQRRDAARARLARQRAELAALLRSAYAIGDAAPLKLFLSQDRVADANRLLALHGYLERDRARRIAALRDELRELDALQAAVEAERDALADTRARQQSQLAQLQRDRSEREKTAQALERSYKDKRSREQALGGDVAGLKKLLAQLRAAAARAEAARKAAASARSRAAGTRPPAPVVANAAPIHVGGLGWPLSGALLAGYGKPLPDGGDSTGLLIGAPAGTPVAAVANGKVVFADWMNGYGLLIIIDHGNGYMSLYAHNEALLRDVGDSVSRGDRVASVGSSGGAGPSGLYFELRKDGSPVDPARWLKAR